MTELVKAIIFGIIEGITEWLPVSSTGHMILLDEFLTLHVSPQFKEMFLVVVQLGAIFAVIVLFRDKIWPFAREGHGGAAARISIRTDILTNWVKIAAACFPAVIFVVLGLDEICDALFYNPVCVSVALIVFGVAFIAVERRNAGRAAVAATLQEITYPMAVLIGFFQLIAAAFPGTSRSGATIVGALLIGVSRTAASEFTFILAIPVMFGASLLKLTDFGFAMTREEWTLLAAGMVSAFLVSVAVIRFLLGYIRRHDFKVFGWYRIALGAVVLAYFGLR